MPRAPISERPAGPPSARKHNRRRNMMPHFVGLDWASAEHAVCVIDEQGQVKLRAAVTHSAKGLEGLRRQLTRFDEPTHLPVAIERPSGLLVDTLVEAGFPLVPIHPNAVKAARPRYSAAQ